MQNIVEDIVDQNESGKSKQSVFRIPWPTRDNIPISEFTTKFFFTLAFPCLFPYGTGDFYVNRPVTCSSMAQWADHLIWYKDGRLAKQSYFKFIVHNIIIRKRTLEQSTYIVKQQLGDEHFLILRSNFKMAIIASLKKFFILVQTCGERLSIWLRELKN